ncbi:MAG TPA: toxic anion resistance protein [Dermatophilaceae bacterium]|nr:toxic anion resistance protein [Dermatophilaceae bacterium]
MTSQTPGPTGVGGLDLGPAAPEPAHGTETPAHAVTPAEPDSPTRPDLAVIPPRVSDVALSAPAAVPAIDPAQVSAMVPLDQQTAAALADRARAWVAEVAALDPRDPEYVARVKDVTSMGQTEIRSSSDVSNRMLQAPARSLTPDRTTGSPPGPATRAVNSLGQLRRVVQDLDPSQLDKPTRRLLGLIPFGDRLRDYFDRYRSSQAHLEAIISALRGSQRELTQDSLAIEAEKATLWQLMTRLQEYAVLAACLDGQLDMACDRVAATDPAKADALRADLLFAVRQKHQDLLTQLAVATQSFLALDLVRRTNSQLVTGVERATTTTVSALRTAVIVAQALANQRLVLDQISVLGEATSTLIVSTSEALRQQTGAVSAQSTQPPVSLEALREAFRNVYATMDALDDFTAQSLRTMSSTVTALEGEVSRSRAYLERAQQRSGPPEGS